MIVTAVPPILSVTLLATVAQKLLDPRHLLLGASQRRRLRSLLLHVAADEQPDLQTPYSREKGLLKTPFKVRDSGRNNFPEMGQSYDSATINVYPRGLQTVTKANDD
ncbi:unnamed protein product [Caenorhabditis nigoni]